MPRTPEGKVNWTEKPMPLVLNRAEQANQFASVQGAKKV